MPLDWMLALVAGGIAGIAALTWALGWAAPLRLATPREACRWWDRERPERPARGATLAAGGHAALIETEAGPGLVWVMGQDCTTIDLAGAFIRPAPDGLEIRRPDFAAPRLRVRLDAGCDRAAWAALITDPAPTRATEDPAEWAI
jgi:hypothetical protein